MIDPYSYPGNPQQASEWILDELRRLNEDWGLVVQYKINHRLNLNSFTSRTLGFFKFKNPSLIELSPQVLEMKYGAIIDVVRHEFSHALDYNIRETTDHSPKWREVAKAVGCRPRATSSEDERIAATKGKI